MTHHARFSIIPGWIVTDPRLKGRDLQVLCVLGRHTDKQGWCIRSQVKMAAEIDCARSTVQASIDRLVEIGVVEKHARESADGRDSAHFYRVLYDRAPPAGYAFDAYEGGEAEENILADAASDATPPADISAPPADPESAPPAGPGSAPINDPSLTPPSERMEKNAGEPAEEDRRSIERGFMRLVKIWPNVEGLPPDGWFSAWLALTLEERRDAERLYPEWIKVLEKGGKAGKHTPRPSTYFRSKLWQSIPEPPAPVAPIEPVAAFGKGGMAYRLWILNQPERPHPAPTGFVATILAEGGERADAEMINRRAAYSWPRLVELDRRTAERAAIRVAPDIVALGAEFVSVELAGPVGVAWRRLFKRMRMPWLPAVPGQPDWPKYAYLPPIEAADEDLDKAVAAAWWQFSERCKGHADAA